MKFMKLMTNVIAMSCIVMLVGISSVYADDDKENKGKDITNPAQFPSPPNNEYGTYEPSMTADEKTIYFAQFPPPVGHPDNQDRDLYVSYKKKKDEWTEPERLPSPPNSPYMDTEPMISADGRTLVFQSNRPGGYGNSDIWVSRLDSQTNEWGEPENFGPPINTEYKDHCLIRRATKDGEVAYWASKRPDGHGGVINYGSGDIYASIRSINGEWSVPWNLGPDVNTAGNQCRFVPGLGSLIGVVTDHDSSHHQEFLVHYDTDTGEWVGPRIFSGTNSPDMRNDGCGNFTYNGKKWFWSSGKNLPPGYIFPEVYDMVWVKTKAIEDYYEDETGIDLRD